MKKAIRKGFCVFMLAGCGLVANACAVDATPESESGQLGESDEFLGESGCATQSCTHANSCVTIDLPDVSECAFQIHTSTSPDAGYGTSACPNAYVVNLTAPTGQTFVPYIDWGDVPLTSSNCASGKLDMAVHTRPNSSSSWTTTIHRYHGVWNGSSCVWVINSGYSEPAEITETATNQVRVAGTAKVGSTGYRIVTVGATVGHGPC